MLTLIDRLPDQLASAWAQVAALSHPASFKRADRIVIAAVGSAAISAEIVAALYADTCNIPIVIHRGDDLPAYADGQSTLVVLLSADGNDAETLAAAELADARGVQALAITAGGVLADRVMQMGGTIWRYAPVPSARAAMGNYVGLLIGLLGRAGLIADPSTALNETIGVLRERIATLGAASPAVKNPAKRLAGQMIGRLPLIVGTGLTIPIARHWQAQLNMNGKAWAQVEALPDAAYIAINGTPSLTALSVLMNVVFLSAPPFESSLMNSRLRATSDLFMQQGLAVDRVDGVGKSALAQALSLVQYGDYVSYYVAMAYGVDPSAAFNESTASGKSEN